MTTTATIYFHPDIVERADTALVGRRAAGTSFLKGYMQRVQADAIHCVADEPSSLDEFRNICAQNGWQGDVVCQLMGDREVLTNPGPLFVPGPSLAKYAWSRRASADSHAICGITHTLSTKRIQADLAELLFAPVAPSDAIICTSDAARRVVEHHLDAAEGYLQERFGTRNVARPMLPVIPLGIDASRFTHTPSKRQEMRRRLNLSEKQIVLMTMGRLSLAEKMSPGPMFLALERATRAIRQRLTLLMVGWFSDKPSEKLFKTMAAAMAPSVDVLFVDGKDESLRTDIWAAADIFTLPVDNIQETFGLAPVEAMAAGLPVVCSDWNGFKDTVVHGQTGFRIPTMAPSSGSGNDLATRYGSDKDQYTQYLMSISQQVCIDIAAYSEAVIQLATDASLRKAMGNAGRKRASELYDWSVIIPQYQSLWTEQTEIRSQNASKGKSAKPRAALTEIDPFQSYAHYPTATMSPETEISAPTAVDREEIHRLLILSGATTIDRTIASPADFCKLQNVVHQNSPLRLNELSILYDEPVSRVQALVLWLAKYGLVTVDYEASQDT